MNHCLLEVQVKRPPTIRYTQDNKTPIAEMEVIFEGLRADDPPASIKVVGWGNMAQELQNSVQVEQKLIIEGRLRMNTIPKQDGTKEKKAEFTLSKLHFPNQGTNRINSQPNPAKGNKVAPSASNNQSASLGKSDTPANEPTWDSSPLIPDTDEIPF